MTNRREALESSMRKATEQYGEAAARMAEDNGALLREYAEGIERIATAESPLPVEFHHTVQDLAAEIVRRMNRGAGQ